MSLHCPVREHGRIMARAPDVTCCEEECSVAQCSVDLSIPTSGRNQQDPSKGYGPGVPVVAQGTGGKCGTRINCS